MKAQEFVDAWLATPLGALLNKMSGDSFWKMVGNFARDNDAKWVLGLPRDAWDELARRDNRVTVDSLREWATAHGYRTG